MRPGQRRALWLCTFALAFIFFFEASGVGFVWDSNAPQAENVEAARSNFQHQMGLGTVFLMLGTAITVLLQPRDPEKREPYHPLEWAAMAVGLAVLIGTAWRSWQAVSG